MLNLPRRIKRIKLWLRIISLALILKIKSRMRSSRLLK
jgi:hypothetical protein